MPRVNPKILRWARETAGFDIDEAGAKLLDLRPTKGLSSRDRLKALESGEIEPSRALLAKMANLYRRPLLAFYLSEAPPKADRGRDFRKLPEDHSGQSEAMLDALVRDIRARQSTIRALMEEEDEAEKVPFVGSAQRRDGVRSLAARIRAALAFDLEAFRSQPSPDTAFSLLRASAETAGVFVLLIGDLGSYHSELDVDTFRGIALSDPFAPIIVINDHDARSSWSFTLLHEMAHLVLGQSGVSGYWSDLAIERLCNDVASEMLLSSREMEAFRTGGFTPPDLRDRIEQFARRRNISNSMVAYRLFRQGILSHSQWNQSQAFFRERWVQGMLDKKAKERPSGGGPDYYVVRRHRLGTHLIDFAARMVRAGALTTSKAGRLLGVQPSNVHRLMETLS